MNHMDNQSKLYAVTLISRGIECWEMDGERRRVFATPQAAIESMGSRTTRVVSRVDEVINPIAIGDRGYSESQDATFGR
jgi:hypothetical protein